MTGEEQIPDDYIRKIIHVDMDAFYASVEQLHNPGLRGKPIAVGGSRERGVVAAASYEARQYGVKSAMPSVTAARQCPDLIFVKPDFEKYRAISQQIRSIFLDYTPLVEPLSLDEAYLDVTDHLPEGQTATRLAREMRQRIKSETGLNASAGISINKFLAKVASDINKPNGQKTILPEHALNFMEELPIQKFYGVGSRTAEKMHALGIFYGKDLKTWSLGQLINEFGKVGSHYHNIVRGLQRSKVKPERIRKSVGAERTFSQDLSTYSEMAEALSTIMDKLKDRISKASARGKTVVLKIKDHDFEIQSRSYSWEEYTDDAEQILNAALGLLRDPLPQKPVRLLGITLANLEKDYAGIGKQLSFDFSTKKSPLKGINGDENQ